jgi:hypothetical protein
VRATPPRIAALSLLVALVLPAWAAAQQPTATDPPGDSPSGTIYQIPVERGRDDAKPLGDGAPEQSSRYRSENNFGSSSKVPGAGESGSTRDRDDDSAAGALPGGGGPSGGDSGGSGVTGGGGPGAGNVASHGGDDPSGLWLFALLGAILLAAVLAGTVAVRARHASS